MLFMMPRFSFSKSSQAALRSFSLSSSADLNELYLFEADSHKRRPTPIVPKDRMLAELTIQRKECIVTFHEHDSLLENKSDEELNENERKAAWEDFENEKRGIMNNIVPEAGGFLGIPEMMGLSGRSVAGIPLNNIAAMIYNSNPGISQDEFLGRLRLTVRQFLFFSFTINLQLHSSYKQIRCEG